MNHFTALYFVSCLLLSASVWAQPIKGNWVVNPQLVASELSLRSDAETSSQVIDLGSSVHYYVGHKLAVGFWLRGRYENSHAKVSSRFDRRLTLVDISPEIHYSLLRSRLSPYLRARLGWFGYAHQFIDNPAFSTHLRKAGNFFYSSPLNSPTFSGGLMYSIKKKLAINAQLNAIVYPGDSWYQDYSVNIGAQFVIN